MSLILMLKFCIKNKFAVIQQYMFEGLFCLYSRLNSREDKKLAEFCNAASVELS